MGFEMTPISFTKFLLDFMFDVDCKIKDKINMI
jgi:hypothetical protein